MRNIKQQVLQKNIILVPQKTDVRLFVLHPIKLLEEGEI
jgi:hypothetical protein